MLSLHAPKRQTEPLRVDAAFQSYEVNNVAVDHVFDGGQLSSHASPPVTLTDELLSIAICLGPLLLQKAAIRGCRSSKVPSRPKSPSRYPHVIAVIFFSFCGSYWSTRNTCRNASSPLTPCSPQDPRC